MRHLPKIAALAAILMLAASGCAGAAEIASANDTARFLAGMQPSAGSPLAPLTQDPAWQRHARFFDAAFAELDRRQLSRISAWSQLHLAAPRPTMFYMFSGPDFLYADAFYSKASTYVLSALEPTGPIPDVMKLARFGIGPALNYVEQSLQSILSFSFFITEKMKVELRAGGIGGTMPILYVFLARSGKTVRDVSLIWLDDNGAIHQDSEAPTADATRGTRITFVADDGAERTLYYFATDLSNSGVRSSGFLKFCEPLAPGNSLIKSASYLLHAGNFTVMRDWLLANSSTIIQDDSGIPLARYDPRKWRFFPFGRYLGPIDKFPGRYQERYAEVFQRGQPLDFGIGYRWRTFETNVLLSVRVAPDDPVHSEAAAEPLPQAPPPKPAGRARLNCWDRRAISGSHTSDRANEDDRAG
jgi:hypothetical protein